MEIEIKYRGRKAVSEWFGKLTSQGPERSLIHKSRVPNIPKGAAAELFVMNGWVVNIEGDYFTYWQESA